MILFEGGHDFLGVEKSWCLSLARMGYTKVQIFPQIKGVKIDKNVVFSSKKAFFENSMVVK